MTGEWYRMTRAAQMVALAALTVVTLAGCGGAEPESGSIADEVPTTSSAPPTPPALRPAAKRHDREGAAEFARYWFALLGYSFRTGDAAPLRQASDRDCAVCNQALTIIRDGYTGGASLEGGRYTVREARALETSGSVALTVVVTYDRTPRSRTTPLGGSTKELDGAGYADCDLRLRWTGSAWKVNGVDATEPVV
ncbi:DUF6318 family protein [Cryptosporangium minutisporangium]|uniref:DUF6318 domain-containing protein n=1 Tax=Cryptosporangium minutisporangium TaxID=113569 RepID=A0ABP6SS10_9ACTN